MESITGLIEVKQLPIIAEKLHDLKSHWDQMAHDASEMVCTEDTIQSVKAYRADMRKEFEAVDNLRKEIKAQALAPWYSFEETFQDCVTNAYKKADSTFKEKISEVEEAQKKRCEDDLRNYFAELCAVRHLDWLEFERAGIKINMASAKAKTPKKLREQLIKFVSQVGDSVDRIVEMEYAEEIMIEFQDSLDAFDAIRKVQKRHQEEEQAKDEIEKRKTILTQEKETVRRIESLSPPKQIEQPQIFECSFKVHATMEQLKKLKEFLNMEGIKYE